MANEAASAPESEYVSVAPLSGSVAVTGFPNVTSGTVFSFTSMGRTQ